MMYYIVLFLFFTMRIMPDYHQIMCMIYIKFLESRKVMQVEYVTN